MVMRVGMIGFSEGNGHPYSFSAIVNGYDKAAFDLSGWEVISGYLQKRKKLNLASRVLKLPMHGQNAEKAQSNCVWHVILK